MLEERELLLSSSGLATRLLAGGLAGSVEILKRSFAGFASSSPSVAKDR